MKTIQFASLAALALLPAMTAPAQTASPFSAQKLEWSVTRQHTLNYLLYLPPGYNSDTAKRWPLMLFLHGAGERGTDVQKVAVHGPLAEAQQGTNFPFIIVAPQCPDAEIWDNEQLLQLLKDTTAKLRVDTNRVYLTGLSMGGFGTWKLGLRHPELFAAIAPICGGGSMIDTLGLRPSQTAALKSLPVWAFHGAKDPVVPQAESERMVAMLKRMGCQDVKLTVYPEADHNSWAQTYDNPEFYAWLLSKQRVPAANKP
jgi:predicted peptidase